MSDLVEFLRARYDERAAKAQAAMRGGEGRWTQADPELYPGLIEDERRETVVYDEGRPSEEQAAHIAENDPARVLREVESKRRLLEQFKLRGDSVRATVQPATGGVWDDLLRMLALPYADHDEFREEWQV
jgi:hypothetical protein